jgi:hypothetical protein
VAESEPQLNWATADVKDGKLTVSLDGKQPSGWEDIFEKTVRLLGSRDWDGVKIKKQTVEVQRVAPGTEDKLRHYLESVVEQANAAHRPDEDEKARERQESERSQESGPDAEMTERFRSFGEQTDSDEADEAE